MTKKETLALMNAIKCNYPRFYENANESAAADIWHEALCDEDYDSIRKALIQFIKSDQKGYPPLIGQLIAIVRPKAAEDPFVW